MTFSATSCRATRAAITLRRSDERRDRHSRVTMARAGTRRYWVLALAAAAGCAGAGTKPLAESSAAPPAATSAAPPAAGAPPLAASSTVAPPADSAPPAPTSAPAPAATSATTPAAAPDDPTRTLPPPRHAARCPPETANGKPCGSGAARGRCYHGFCVEHAHCAANCVFVARARRCYDVPPGDITCLLSGTQAMECMDAICPAKKRR